MTSSPDPDHLTAAPEVPWYDPTSDDDIFGVARYLADAVVHGDISEEDGENALLDWAGRDRDVLARAAKRIRPDSETEHLLRAAYHHAA